MKKMSVKKTMGGLFLASGIALGTYAVTANYSKTRDLLIKKENIKESLYYAQKNINVIDPITDLLEVKESKKEINNVLNVTKQAGNTSKTEVITSSKNTSIQEESKEEVKEETKAVTKEENTVKKETEVTKEKTETPKTATEPKQEVPKKAETKKVETNKVETKKTETVPEKSSEKVNTVKETPKQEANKEQVKKQPTTQTTPKEETKTQAPKQEVTPNVIEEEKTDAVETPKETETTPEEVKTEVKEEKVEEKVTPVTETKTNSETTPKAEEVKPAPSTERPVTARRYTIYSATGTNGEFNFDEKCTQRDCHEYIWYAMFTCNLNECEGFNEPGSNRKSESVIISRRGDVVSITMNAPKAKAGYVFVGWEESTTTVNYATMKSYRAVYKKAN